MARSDADLPPADGAPLPTAASSASASDPAAPVLARLLAALKADGYRFVTPTPATHRRVIARAPERPARDLRDVFGWSRVFAPGLLDRALETALVEVGWIEPAGTLLRSRVRVASLGDDLFVHSAFPTDAPDAVFFGPDSYRFARCIVDALDRKPLPHAARLVDLGTGSGVGAVVAARRCDAADVTMTDINPAALRLARINVAAAGVAARFVQAGDLASVAGEFDFILANPPYVIDAERRTYRDGGGLHGAEVALAMVDDALPRLAPGGRLLLYTGSAIVDGRDALGERLAARAQAAKLGLAYADIDPDVFGEELESPAYRDVERIAVVTALFERRAAPRRRAAPGLTPRRASG